MKKEQLQERITKKQEQIKKIEKRIQKWESNKNSKEAFIKEYSWLNHFEERKGELLADWIIRCDKELRYANDDLKEAKETLVKYENMLAMEQAKTNELENNRIDVIWNFLLQYKENCKKYIRNNLKWVKEYYRLDSECCDLHNKRYYYLQQMSEEEYKQKRTQVEIERREAKEAIHPITSNVVKRSYTNDGEREYSIDEDKLEEILLQDIENRYFRLINQITKYVGHIQDASYLRVGAKGDLNGYIIGDEGKAKVETIGAGGYNIQCFHYRTLVNKF